MVFWVSINIKEYHKGYISNSHYYGLDVDKSFLALYYRTCPTTIDSKQQHWSRRWNYSVLHMCELWWKSDNQHSVAVWQHNFDWQFLGESLWLHWVTWKFNYACTTVVMPLFCFCSTSLSFEMLSVEIALSMLSITLHDCIVCCVSTPLCTLCVWLGICYRLALVNNINSELPSNS